MTIVTRKNGEPVHLKEPIPKVKFLKLISCSLYNSWFNLNEEGIIWLDSEDKVKTRKIKISPGHDTLDSIIKIINNLAKRQKYNEYLKKKPFLEVNGSASLYLFATSITTKAYLQVFLPTLSWGRKSKSAWCTLFRISTDQ